MCTFNAEAKLELRRRVICDLTLDPEEARAVVNAIDAERWAHLEVTHCPCWSEAVRAAGGLATNDLMPAEIQPMRSFAEAMSDLFEHVKIAKTHPDDCRCLHCNACWAFWEDEWPAHKMAA